jgi:hypothetical protein
MDKRQVAVIGAATLALSACSTAGSVSSFVPGGEAAANTRATATANGSAAASAFGFTFPAGYSVQFGAVPGASSADQAVVQVLEQQQAGFRYALYVDHGSSRYLQWTEANAAPLFRAAVSQARSHNDTESGVVQYSSIQITNPIYSFASGSGTSGTFCLIVSGARDYNSKTSKSVSPVMPAGLYQFSMHKDPGGSWEVAGVQKGGSSCSS